MSEIDDLIARARGQVQPQQATPVVLPALQQPAYTPPAPQQAVYYPPAPSAVPGGPAITSCAPASLDDREVRDFGSGPPLIPWINLVGRFTLDRVAHAGLRNSKAAYKLTCTCLESSDPQVAPGGQYVYMFDYLVDPRTDGEKTKVRAALSNTRNLVAAALRQNPNDPSYEANKAMATLLKICNDSPDALGLQFKVQQTLVPSRKTGQSITKYAFSPA